MLSSTFNSVCRQRQQLVHVYNDVSLPFLKARSAFQVRNIANVLHNCQIRRSKESNKMITTIEQPCVLPKFSSTAATTVSSNTNDASINNSNNNNNIINKPSNELSINEQYEEAVKVLNTLQSNADTIRRSIALNNKQMPLDDTYKYLERSGLSLNAIEARLSFVHVSGTKGKGSTCALTESILRAYGMKTGFFSSPHLVSVTERIRINGAPIDKLLFVQVFWRVYNRLQQHKETATDMPAYFKFLTILCLHIFLQQQVDVVILEVGIGGEYDCTNIIRNTKTVGITSLGLEHTQLLGNTLAEIAWQKAGIIKPHADVYTTVTQSECLEVVRQRANDKQAKVHIVPELSSYGRDAKTKSLLANLNSVAQLNGSLAIELALDWLRKDRPVLLQREYGTTAANTTLSDEVLHGLTQCVWPGRCQLLQVQNLNMHLDGAHTLESMRVCSSWFQRVAGANGHPKVLIFNTTGDRDSRKLLESLRQESDFDLACFVPNISSGCGNRGDMQSVYGISEQIKRAKVHAGYWHLLCAEADEIDNSQVFGSTLDALQFIDKRYALQQQQQQQQQGQPQLQQVDVLVTGSLHLIGATLAALEEFQGKPVPQ